MAKTKPSSSQPRHPDQHCGLDTCRSFGPSNRYRDAEPNNDVCREAVRCSGTEAASREFVELSMMARHFDAAPDAACEKVGDAIVNRRRTQACIKAFAGNWSLSKDTVHLKLDVRTSQKCGRSCHLTEKLGFTICPRKLPFILLVGSATFHRSFITRRMIGTSPYFHQRRGNLVEVPRRKRTFILSPLL